MKHFCKLLFLANKACCAYFEHFVNVDSNYFLTSVEMGSNYSPYSKLSNFDFFILPLGTFSMTFL